MAWTDGVDYSTGQLISATIWNNYLGAAGDIDLTAPGVVTTAGDTVYATGDNTLARLAKGTARQTLAMNSGATAPEWAASSRSVLTTAGDVMYASGTNTPARLAKGTARQNLTMNSGASAPEWTASAASLLTAEGDILYASGANTPARLAKGTDNYVLAMNGNVPNWEAAGGGGKIAQMKCVTGTTTFTTTSGSFAETGIELVITPTSADNDMAIWFIGSTTLFSTNDDQAYTIYRESTNLLGDWGNGYVQGDSQVDPLYIPLTVFAVDAAPTDSEVTYGVYAMAEGGSTATVHRATTGTWVLIAIEYDPS